METKQKRKTRTAAPTPRKQPKKAAAAQAGSDVVYLPPKPFSRNRLILQLATMAAIVLALVLGLSVFFKVDSMKITVSGASKYSAEDVAKASGIKDGDNLLTFSRARAAGKIQTAMPYVRDVRIGIELPDTVHIEIVEVEVTYAVAANDGWWLVSSEGKIVEKAGADLKDYHGKILGVELADPKVGQQAKAYQQDQEQTDPEGNVIPITVTQQKRLETALDIAGFLERNRIIGKIASIDVTDMGDLELWYGRQFRIELGDQTDLLPKITSLKAALEQYLTDRDSGVLDVTDPQKVVYTEF